VLERLTKLWIFTTPPSALLGNVAEPPGNVMGNAAALATSVGASTENVSVSVCVPSVLWQPIVNVCEPRTAPAVPPNGMRNPTTRTDKAARSNARRRRSDPTIWKTPLKRA
jgi:hypothetical protein